VAPVDKRTSILQNLKKKLYTTNGPVAFSLKAPQYASFPVISPFISSFEVWARFEAGDATGALDLIRAVWDHMQKGSPYYSGGVWETLGPDAKPKFGPGTSWLIRDLRAPPRGSRSTCWECGQFHPVTKLGALNLSPAISPGPKGRYRHLTGRLRSNGRRTLLRKIVRDSLPWLRGKVSQQKRFIGTIQDDERILRYVNSKDAPRLSELGTSCPDHFLRTKIKPLYVDWNPQTEDVASLKQKLSDGLEKYRQDYADYYERCKHTNSPAMRDPNPTVVLIPGLGMIAWGKDKSESRVTAEFYNCAVEVMCGAEAIDEYIALPQQEAFDIECWLLEEAKLQRMPAEKELARQIIVVIGAGSGIGKETAHRLVKDGAHIVSVDLNKEAAESTAKEIEGKYGTGIGVAGSGISGCGPAVGLVANITDRKSIRHMLDQVALAYGDFDSICLTAGIFVPSDTTGHIPDDKWALTFNINVTGGYLVGDEAAKTWKEQGLRANLVLTTSANAVVAKKGSVAYDTSKAAANHLVRELAIELSPLVRVNGVAPATVVKGSAMFPRDRVIGSLAKYNIPYTDDEETESLVNKLAQFYADRTLTRAPITPADQAEAYFILVTNRLSKTTGQVITVDGGLHEAFLR
jgi:rhamnulose-1-phosphate aldolase/alcohol dehydrogenase